MNNQSTQMHFLQEYFSELKIFAAKFGVVAIVYFVTMTLFGFSFWESMHYMSIAMTLPLDVAFAVSKMTNDIYAISAIRGVGIAAYIIYLGVFGKSIELLSSSLVMAFDLVVEIGKFQLKGVVESIRNNPAMLCLLKFPCWLMALCLYLYCVYGLLVLWNALSKYLPFNEGVDELVTIIVASGAFYVVAILFVAIKSRVVNAIKKKLTESGGGKNE